MIGAFTSGQILGLLSVVTAMVAGQVLFKQSASGIVTDAGVLSFIGSFLTLRMFAALFLYGGGTLLWVVLLKTIPLSRAYPFAALSFAVLPIISVFMFHETVNARYIAGLICLLVGLYLITTADSG